MAITTQSKLTTIYNIRMRQGAKARIIHYQQPQKQQVQAPKTYRKASYTRKSPLSTKNMIETFGSLRRMS